jgi:hypothetical protein
MPIIAFDPYSGTICQGKSKVESQLLLNVGQQEKTGMRFATVLPPGTTRR